MVIHGQNCAFVATGARASRVHFFRIGLTDGAAYLLYGRRVIRRRDARLISFLAGETTADDSLEKSGDRNGPRRRNGHPPRVRSINRNGAVEQRSRLSRRAHFSVRWWLWAAACGKGAPDHEQ